MIELDNTKVLRFRYEEVMRLKHDLKDNDDPGIDWFATHLMRQFPNMIVLAKLHDQMSDYIWVIMRENYPVVEQHVRYRADTNWIEEQLVN